jgi:hypothetical protein
MPKIILSLILISITTIIIIFSLILSYEKNNNQKIAKNDHSQDFYITPTQTIKPTNILISSYNKNPSTTKGLENCPPIVNDNLIKEISFDLDNNNKIELIKIYGKNDCQDEKPISIKIYEKESQCYIEKYAYPEEEKGSYSYQSHEFNLLQKAEIVDNFLNENKKALLVEGAANACGSGSEISLIFITRDSRGFNLIKGPFISEIDFYILHPQFPGKYILIGEAIWDQGESHFDVHRYRLFIYKYENNQYNKKEILATNRKYAKDKNIDFQNFLNKLNNIFVSEIDEKNMLENLRKKVSELQL